MRPPAPTSDAIDGPFLRVARPWADANPAARSRELVMTL